MTRTRWLGIGLLVSCAAFTAAAIGAGLAMENEAIAKPIGIPLAIGLLVAADVTFWSGGALLGLSFFAKRATWLTRLLKGNRAPAPRA
jgi:hypothetical protein